MMMHGRCLGDDSSSEQGEETSHSFAIAKPRRERTWGRLGGDSRLAVGVAHDVLDGIPINVILLRRDFERALERQLLFVFLSALARGRVQAL